MSYGDKLRSGECRLAVGQVHGNELLEGFEEHRQITALDPAADFCEFLIVFGHRSGRTGNCKATSFWIWTRKLLSTGGSSSEGLPSPGARSASRPAEHSAIFNQSHTIMSSQPGTSVNPLKSSILQLLGLLSLALTNTIPSQTAELSSTKEKLAGEEKELQDEKDALAASQTALATEQATTTRQQTQLATLQAQLSEQGISFSDDETAEIEKLLAAAQAALPHPDAPIPSLPVPEGTPPQAGDSSSASSAASASSEDTAASSVAADSSAASAAGDGTQPGPG